MKRVSFALTSVSVLLLSAGASAQQKLLITEVASSPTPAEFVEIYNPNSAAVDLTNYYLADNSTYYKLVEAAPPATGANDFVARFPSGQTIQPGEYQTISIAGAECFKTACGTVGNFVGFGM